MALLDQIAKDMERLRTAVEFGEQITYNGAAILAVPFIGDSSIAGNTYTHTGRSSLARFNVWEADVPTPKSGDKIVYKGTTWRVARVINSAGGMHNLEATAKEVAV